MMDRRQFLQSAFTTAALSGISRTCSGLAAPAPDFKLRIAPVWVELAPGKTLRTIGYNGQVPGPTLRMREGLPVRIEVTNATQNPELVHWHGLHIPSVPDGAMEEGSTMIAPGESHLYRFIPNPSGTRWYHTHTTAMRNLELATYSGQFGFLMVEPRSEPGSYDQEIFLAVHHWEPKFVPSVQMRDGCPAIVYKYASFNGRLLGAGEPIRTRAGQRVLFHFLNASPTENVLIYLPGHRFTVVALDGNPVPRPAAVEILSLAVAERVDAWVEMDTPGKWILGAVDDAERNKGLGVVVEYAGSAGRARWLRPAGKGWSYARFSGETRGTSRKTPDASLDMLFEKRADPEGGPDQWTINGKPFPEVPMMQLERGRRYRLRMMNATGCAHPVHLHRHSFELVSVNQLPLSGILKDTVGLDRYNVIEADFTADNPGLTLLHCHQQFHMDYGFMQLLKYSDV